MTRAGTILVLFAVVTASCSGPEPDVGSTEPPTTISPITTSPVTTSQDPSQVTTSPVTTSPVGVDIPAPIQDLELTTLQLGDRTLVVAVADTADARSQGLMFITDLGDLDGMIFSWSCNRTGTFWMKNTLIPLDIAWFDSSGSVVGTQTMVPCAEDPCARYGPEAPYQFAIETAAGELDFVTASTRLVLGAD